MTSEHDTTSARALDVETTSSETQQHTFVNIAEPSVARAYDWYLGGSHNTAVDRAFAEQYAHILPAKTMAIDNRQFLRRVVTYLIETEGIRQFVDIGSGIPTVGNVHEIAHEITPDVKVVYVDNDPVAVEQSRIILRDNPHARVIDADLRTPAHILDHHDLLETLDLTQPTAVLMVAVLHFVGGDHDPDHIIGQYLSELPAGSFLAVSHLSHEHVGSELAEKVHHGSRVYRDAGKPLYSRNSADLAHWLRRCEVFAPGIVPVTQWRPESPHPDTRPEHQLIIGALARTR
ncbi:hypothetical protein CFN78_23770 [Amycolatopsis antarctica]|uniref:S-adenosyl methyltransferase n=1 Tax=Amycolatopsis antarctica TaxID=1854586 RepID=A0A263D013_9PSEU|nr:SAM-dependent methyltransferase [Amycolatopsis antarctica]OZM70695.1 hypothetical protein CFN78_23770 [Amycolatopsis antarctica]